jgi:cytochrome b561
MYDSPRCTNRRDSFATAAHRVVLCIAKFMVNHLAGRRQVAAIKVMGAIGISAVGVAGLVRDSWPAALPLPGINLHALFGAVLWITVVAKFCNANRGAAPLSGADVYALRRGLSHGVYLLLYVVFGFNQVVQIAATLWNNGTHGVAHAALVSAPENLRDYLAYGVCALLTIQGLAALQSHTLKRLVLPQP